MPVIVAHLDHRSRPIDAGIGDHDVETPERCDGRSDHLAGVSRIGGIAGDSEPPDFVGDRFKRFTPAARDHDVGAFRGESAGDCGADAGASSRDDRHASGQLLHHRRTIGRTGAP